MEPIIMVVDEETGVGIREDEAGHIVVLGRPHMPPNVRCALEMVLSIWKYGLQLDAEKEARHEMQQQQ